MSPPTFRKPVTIALFSRKGGNGKTQVSVCLSVEFMRRGHRVTLLDTDPQGGSLIFANRADHFSHLRPITVGVGGDERTTTDEIVNNILAEAAKSEVTIIDTPGAVVDRSACALTCADFAILPFLPSYSDYGPLSETIEMVRNTQKELPSLKARVLINCMPKKPSNLDRQMNLAARGLGFPVFDCELTRYEDIKQAYALGQGVTVYKPNGAAALQIKTLVDEIESWMAEP